MEGAIESVVAAGGVGAAVAVLLAGVVVLTVAVERLVGYLGRAAVRLRVSLFALAVVLTGFEFDDTVVAVVLSAGELESVALGTALGTGMAVVGVTLALAAVVRPFPVELPTDYVLLFALSPLVLVPVVLVGTLTAVHGVALLAACLLLFGYVIVREHRRGVSVFRSSDLGEAVRPDGGATVPESLTRLPEDRLVEGRAGAGWLWVAMALLALAGVVVGAMLLEAGTEALLDEFGVEETLFGATVLTAVLTAEDVLLTLEPVRRGVPEIGIGNVVGSVLFSVTGNVGVVALFGGFTVSPSVATVHLPALVVLTALSALAISSGEVRRWHGLVLGGLYLAYWAVAVVVLGGVPIAG